MMVGSVKFSSLAPSFFLLVLLLLLLLLLPSSCSSCCSPCSSQCQRQTTCGFPINTCIAGIQIMGRCTEVAMLSFGPSAFPCSGLVRLGSAQFDSARIGSVRPYSVLLSSARRTWSTCIVKTNILVIFAEVSGFCFGCRSGPARLTLAEPSQVRLGWTQLRNTTHRTWMGEQTRPPH